jgi:cell wall-associated NlpC family hydrolase
MPRSLPRRLLRTLIGLLLCALVTQHPVAVDAVAARDSAVPTVDAMADLVQQARTADAEVRTAELDLFDRLAERTQTDPGGQRTRSLTRLKARSSEDLRMLVREGNRDKLARAAMLMYPGLVDGFTHNDYSAIISSVATALDRQAVEDLFVQKTDIAAGSVPQRRRQELTLHRSSVAAVRSKSIRSVPRVSLRQQILAVHDTLKSRDEALGDLVTRVLRLLPPGASVSRDTLQADWETASARRRTALYTAFSVIGARYEFAARGPDRFDCSGLTAWAWAGAGVSLRLSSLAQRAQVGQLTKHGTPGPGDLVFWPRTTNTDGRVISHVAISIGGGLLVEAGASGTGVRVSTLPHAKVIGWGSLDLVEEHNPVRVKLQAR